MGAVNAAAPVEGPERCPETPCVSDALACSLFLFFAKQAWKTDKDTQANDCKQKANKRKRKCPITWTKTRRRVCTRRRSDDTDSNRDPITTHHPTPFTPFIATTLSVYNVVAMKQPPSSLLWVPFSATERGEAEAKVRIGKGIHRPPSSNHRVSINPPPIN